MNDLTEIKKIIIKKPLKLDCGQEISNFPLAYETYGKLNENKDNAILVFHALTGDQFASGINPITKKNKRVIKLSANESALGISDRAKKILKNLNSNISKYPDGKFKELINEISKKYNWRCGKRLFNK